MIEAPAYTKILNVVTLYRGRQHKRFKNNKVDETTFSIWLSLFRWKKVDIDDIELLDRIIAIVSLLGCIMCIWAFQV